MAQASGFTVKIDSTEITNEDTKGLARFSVEGHLELIQIASFEFEQGAALSKCAIGADVEVSVGGSRLAFKGYVTEYRFSLEQNTGTSKFHVIAMDPLCKLAASRRTKIYEDQKDSDIASAVIGAANCTAGTVDATSETSKYTIQRNESDLVFLKRLAARNGYILVANEGEIDFKKPQTSEDATEIIPDDLISIDMGWSTAQVPTEVTVYGWDYVAKEKVEGTASSSDVTDFALGSGATAVAETGTIWQEGSYISDVLVSSQSAAKAMAVAELNRAARNALRGRAVVKGNGALVEGTKVKFSDLLYQPEGLIVSVRHTMGPEGLHTEIHFCGNTVPVGPE